MHRRSRPGFLYRTSPAFAPGSTFRGTGARVVLRLADGRQYGAQTFAAWPGSGLRLWAFAVPTRFLIAADQRQDLMTGYDAAGHVVWQQRLGASA